MDLLLEIARCPNFRACLANPEAEHACGEIVRSQNVKGRKDFQVPEPWSGHLETAPILFLSSNPSISEDEQYPRLGWGDELIRDFFENRFGEGKQPWITEGRYYLRTFTGDSGMGGFVQQNPNSAGEPGRGNRIAPNEEPGVATRIPGRRTEQGYV
jgi:hypothetical protein